MGLIDVLRNHLRIRVNKYLREHVRTKLGHICHHDKTHLQLKVN